MHRRPRRVARLSYFFPAHNEEANLEGLVAEALDDAARARRDVRDHRRRRRLARPRRGRSPTSSRPRHPGVVRAVHHPTNLGYGAALRSGFAAARYELVAFTDGDRQFRVADIGRLTERLAEADAPGRRRRLPHQAGRPARPDRLRAPLPARQPDLLRPARHRCRLRLQAVPARGARRRRGSSPEGAFFSAELLIKLRAAGRTVVEVGVPHYPRTAGSPTGAKPQVILRAVRDFWRLRLRMWANRERALRRGGPIVATARPSDGD